MKNKKCIFCDIVDRKEKAVIIYEDENILGFMDTYPINPGHVLVIPKKHYQDILEAPNLEVGDIFTISAGIGKHLIKCMEADGLNIGQNNGAVASQVIFHLHVHLIPRFIGDTEGKRWPERKKATWDELELTGNKIKQSLEK